MKTKRTQLTTTLFLVIALCCTSIWVKAAAADEGKVSFKWAFLQTSKQKNMEEVIDFNKRPKVASGDKLRLYLKPIENAYIYVFLQSSQHGLDLVFPAQIDAYKNAPLYGKDLWVPGKTKFFEMDDSRGTEKFILLASAERLMNLEEITAKYLATHENDAKAKLLEAIKKTRKSFSSLASATEKGVPIAGTFRTRGGEDALPGHATHVEADRFYSKTLRLKHE